jgi:uncharacterized nucleotidyltransferase DUF6036
MDLNQTFHEFFASLISRDVRFLVVGGYAMAAHGHPRYTEDLDVWVWMDPDNARALVQALDDFGFGSIGLSENDFLSSDTVVQLGYPPQRIDLLTSPSGVNFDECWIHRVVIDLDGLSVPFIGIDGLIENKIAAARDQDLVDVKALRRRHG